MIRDRDRPEIARDWLRGVVSKDIDKGVITTAALDLWVSEWVKELTRGSQHPVMSRPPTVPDFPMFAVRN
jgi:hypothetical protein